MPQQNTSKCWFLHIILNELPLRDDRKNTLSGKIKYLLTEKNIFFLICREKVVEKDKRRMKYIMCVYV